MNDSSSTLVTYPNFTERPSSEFILAWRAHIEASGYPETFESVSTSRPIDADGLVLLSEDMGVPTARRTDGLWVPCPICSPLSPKFKNGRMAWFPLERAVRFIGHNCAKSHYGDLFTSADRRFQVETRLRRYMSRWAQLQPRARSLQEFFEPIAAVGLALQLCRDNIDQHGNGFIALLRAPLLRTDGAIVELQTTGQVDSRGQAEAVNVELARISGLTFLNVPFHLGDKVTKIKAAIADLSSDLPEWNEREPDEQKEQGILLRGRDVDEMPGALIELAENAADAQRFFSERNFQALRLHHQKLGFAKLNINFEGKQLSVRAESFAGGHYVRPFAQACLGALPKVPNWLRDLVSKSN